MMRGKHMKLSRITSLILILLMLAAASISAFAAGPVDTDADVTLKVAYKDGEKAIGGAGFALYKVAEVSYAVDFSITPQFSAYSITMDGLDKDGWNALAKTLANYVAQDKLEPLAEGMTAEDGSLVFSGSEDDPMTPGMYLLIGSRCRVGGYYYTPIPTMVFLPALEDNSWVYDASVNPKPGKEKIPDEGTTISLKVLKIWKDEDDERPESITVNLLKDGEISDIQTLTAANDWRHTWNKLDADAEWALTEDVPEGYTVSIERSGITFIVTNTSQEPEDPGDPGDPDDPTYDLDDDDVPHGGAEPGDPEDLDELPDDGIPLAQTGLLWWPVPAMAALGLVFLSIGIYRRREE